MHAKDAITILEHLSKCKPVEFDTVKTRLELRAATLNRALYLVAGACLFAAVLLVLGYKFLAWSPTWLGTALNLLLIGTVLAALIGLLIDPVLLLLRVRRWKADASATAQRALAGDLQATVVLAFYSKESLQLARHWLTTRVGRIDMRISQFFGKETAFIAQVGVVYAVVKEGGGLPWLGREIARGFEVHSFADTLMLYGCAGVFGLSLGAMWLRAIQGMHKHQIDLLELALKQKELSATTSVGPAVEATRSAPMEID